ncbi:hypothetical protein Godav_029177 [Gossypium davidsonii]|uniref:DC1 domain-containing protein n=1 Tax=Gossypium davidsonii TaxID=34287 RepID=A0A7J8TK18_GOSDV|nr:hypothetical protein [Gossypium davidsonii]
MVIRHVIHPYPLSLSFIAKRTRVRRCRGCHRHLSGPTYGCKTCRFFIHKSCLDEHKAEVQSSFHPYALLPSPLVLLVLVMFVSKLSVLQTFPMNAS